MNVWSQTHLVVIDDDPEKYQGRIRTVPHTEGQWPTHVYIEGQDALLCHVFQ